jgi:hypothetical protein
MSYENWIGFFLGIWNVLVFLIDFAVFFSIVSYLASFIFGEISIHFFRDVRDRDLFRILIEEILLKMRKFP